MEAGMSFVESDRCDCTGRHGENKVMQIKQKREIMISRNFLNLSQSSTFHQHRKQCNRGRQLSKLCVIQKFRPDVVPMWFLYVLCLCLILHPVNGQEDETARPFPTLFNAALNRPIITDPSQSTCGTNLRTAYCKSSIYPSSVDPRCIYQDFCVQTCPGRTKLPGFISLLPVTGGFSDCVTADTINIRPGSALGSYSTSISAGPSCFLTPLTFPSFSNSLSFTITVWLWLREPHGTLIQKVSQTTGEIIFELNFRQAHLNFLYNSTFGLLTVTTPDELPLQTWTHVAIQVYVTSVSFFFNGLGSGHTAGHTVSLVSPIQENGDSWVRVGLTLSGTYQFLGRIQDFRFYNDTLSNREIAEDYSGILPEVRVHTSCRCPASHPRIKPLQVHYCIQNGDPDSTINDILRLNSEAHPLEYINDGDSNSIWISEFFDNVDITVDLGDEYQVFYVVIQFYSPLPKAVEIERMRGDGAWETWQLYAEDCQTYFGTANNGPLLTSTSVNCLQFTASQTQYSKGNITFNILNPEPVPRPGYNDFYNTEQLYQFVITNKVRIKMQGHYYVVNDRHKYYGLYEYIVIARCNCHGHAETCDHATLPYQCNCLADSHTEGRLCDRCEPLYRDKEFRRGDLTNAYDCKPCECYGHADECVYQRELDPFPDDHFAGGGGVCFSCKDNTEGRFCDMCIDGYFRPQGKSMYDQDVCSPCDCDPEGVQDGHMICEKVGGQCACKEFVTGRQCNQCKPGFFNLTQQNPKGCDDCSCDPRGTHGGSVTCHATTGVCVCNPNVRNEKCDACQYGFYNLTELNPSGCSPCNCNPFGSLNQYCNPDTGQCECKPNIQSQHCNECSDGFFSFEEGCIPCDCNPIGSQVNQFCDKKTGQCACKLNVEGQTCSTCRDETFGFGLSETEGCVVCNCNPAGTLNGSALCQKDTGYCVCKENVEGATCNMCKGNTWGLNITNELGCVPCECDPSGTQGGSTLASDDLSCHQNTGQCSCLSNRIGRQCEDCQSGYFVNPVPGGGCDQCNCHDFGTAPLTECDTQTGQCECRGGNSGVTGLSCDQCMEGFYGFNGFTGVCQPCDCDPAGSANTTCDIDGGQCDCKEFTRNRRCDRCIAGTSFLEPSNPYGCSKAPAQQPPPEHFPLGPTALRLTWSSPDYPNGVIEQYVVFRNETLVFTLNGNERTYDDIGLIPFTHYSYIILAKNAYGETMSAPVVFQTPAGAPAGIVTLVASNILSKSARFSWNPPQIMNGPLDKYILYSTTLRNSTPQEQWQGTEIQATLTRLIPFTNYTFTVDSCTTGGCLTSEPANFITLSADPEGMNDPVVQAINNTALYIEWAPPEYPNGIIIFYELWMRGSLKSDGSRDPPQMRIFHPGGQYNPNPTQLEQENALPPPATNYTLGGLIPFTVYQFQVLAENDAGKAASEWVEGRTGATTPLSTPAPVIISLSSSSLNVTWEKPADDQSRGIIVLYQVFFYTKTNLTLNPFAPPYMWELLYNATGDEFHYVLRGLSPYSEYTLKIGACNSVGCVNSSVSIGRTDQAIPEGLKKPYVDGYNSSAMEVIWKEPSFPNGPTPYYTLQKTIPALSFPPQVIRGTRFPGGGYYLFPPDTIPPNVEFTGIQFLFRTRQRDGLLLFAASEGRQHEFVALQFKAGRPWFLFDPQDCLTVVQLDASDDRIQVFSDDKWHHISVVRDGVNTTIVVDNTFQGCASFVTPTNDEGLPYNDNTWHHMLAWRDEKVAYISIDGYWKGTRQSSCARGTIIGPNTGVYVGGLPADFEIRRKSTDSRAQLIGHSFQGCIRDIQIMQQKHPVELWKTLDWNDAIANELAFLNWEGCPINLDKGVHFMGQGFARFPSDVMNVANNIHIEFGFRTQMHTGIIFFAHGGKGIYIFCALINGALHFEFANGISPGMATFDREDVNFCDSRWYTVELTKTGQMANITVHNVGTEVSGNSAISLSVVTVSEFFVGGIPADTEAYQFVIDNRLSMPLQAFGGCLRDITFDLFSTLNFLVDTIEVRNVNMDGCTPYHLHADTCKDDLITHVYNGTDMHVFDTGLQPYTDYLYRVLATNDAGSGTSPWGYGRTKEGAPIGVTAPYEARVLSGFRVEVKWRAPVSTAGLMTKFVLKAYNLGDISVPPVEATITNTSKRIGNITELTPHVTYSIKLEACTGGGCAESPDGLSVTTKEEAPQDVASPEALSTPSYMLITWDPPGKPNGVITGYFLYRNKILIYTGGQRMFNITEDLQVYTSYVFYVRACTKIGCTAGPNTTLSTSQLPPSSVDPPTLIVLGTHEMEILWTMPEQLNGVLLHFVLYRSTEAGELGVVAYNSSDYFLDYKMTDLIAGTTYYISLAACTGGGCRISEASNATMAESAPEGIPDPVVVSPSWSELEVTWSEPALPNGVVIEYQLYHNQIPVYTGMGMAYSVDGLLPYSLHHFRVAVCTSQGCGSSSLVQARTRESTPKGFVAMEMTVDDPRTISVTWTMPIEPNGEMFFDVYLDGIFYVDPDNWDYNIIYDRRSLYRGQEYKVVKVISPLIPLSSYDVQVNASNTVGYILSNSMTADMPPGSPDGVRPPTLISQTPTTITVTWVPVGRKNSLDDPMYTLQFRQEPGDIIQDIFGPTASFTHTKENLLAFTSYQFRLVAENSRGSTMSSWVSKVTRQDRPAGFAPPLVVGTGARYIDLVWTPPVTLNGILSEYKLYQNGQYRESTNGNMTTLRADGLNPYTYFTFVLEACTEGGCTRSSPSVATRTLQDYPQNIRPPIVQSLTPGSVELRWSEPGQPNGVISVYEIQRRLPGSEAIASVVTMSAMMDNIYVDEDRILTPYTEYEYRLIVTNGAGEGYSDWVSIVTMSSRPAGIMAPTVKIVGPTIIEVSWSPPLQANGVIEFYTIRLPEPQIQVRNTSELTARFEGLIPYTEYSVTVTACTDGGCTESPPVITRTHATLPQGQTPPIATPVSQFLISILWQGPNRPNGPNIRYELSRLKIRQPLDPTVVISGLWESVYEGKLTFYEDRGLPMFTSYRYRITVYNDVGQLTSDPTPDVTTFGGFPRMAASVEAEATSHLSIRVSWTPPSEVELQGSVKVYTIKLLSNLRNYTQKHGPEVTLADFINLTPDTQYSVTVTITINGGATITSEPIRVTTLDGAPEGVDKPTLTIVSETALRVSWMAPEKPNGEITGYNVYINDQKIVTGMVLPGSYVVSGLQPYTVYTIQVEVCTVFDCVASEAVLGTTAETLPLGVASPRLVPLSSYDVSVMWDWPVQPNGIILRYDLWRKTIKQCSEIPKVTLSPETTKCTYIECGILQNLCGSTCYSGPRVCCDGVLHDSQDGFDCCGTNYVIKTQSDDVCCSGMFYTRKDNYQCCRDRYEQVLPGQVCCPDDTEDRVAVGNGDSCCGTIPYSSLGAQLCCNGVLYDRYGSQCCGGTVVSDTLVCCGGAEEGSAYTQRAGMSCCGQRYVLDDRSLCCTSDTGHIQAHEFESADDKLNANMKCCGLELISKGLSCCNYVGYNPTTHVCADQSHQQAGCGTGLVCPRSQSDMAFCNRCDFDHFTYICGSVHGHFSSEVTPAPPGPSDNCVVSETRIYSGDSLDYVDGSLMPFSLYEYAVSAVNSAGSTKSDFTSIMTLQARPEGLAPPVATLDPKQLYIIYLSWVLPTQPNGEILRFILSRDRIELYRGMDLEYTDDTTILPYRSYSYILTACTVAGCVVSPQVTVATAQGPPEDILPPHLAILNETSLHVTWSPPAKPNGIIIKYQLFFSGDGKETIHNTTELSLILTDLIPYTRYNASLVVCTEVGCTGSGNSTIVMPEAAPEGVRAPTVIIISSTSLDIYWIPPKKPNGEILFYALLRSEQNVGLRLFMGEQFHARDTNLVPGTTYLYFIVTGTSAGNTSSNATSVIMPDNTPADIPAPKNVTVLSPTQIFVDWDAIPPLVATIDQYRVLLNAGRHNQIDKGVGLSTSTSIDSLQPFTEYEVRIQACLQGVPNGCGTGPGITVKTFEAAPTAMLKPTAFARGPDIVDIMWEEPLFPNGIITQYLVYYRNFGTSVELLINRVDGNTFNVRHAGQELVPFTEYEYKIVAGNKEGDVSSPWTKIRTFEDKPTGLPQPIVTVTGAFSINLKWIPPVRPNGIIKQYKIMYRQANADPTLSGSLTAIIVDGGITETSISGFKPNSEYQLQIQASNNVGNVTSVWSSFKTGEAAPSGLALFNIEKIDSGEAVILRWGPPNAPNGVITTYRIFEHGSSVAVFQGLNREFELRRLQPYTEYRVQLEACTSAGCARSFSQSFTTSEVAPTGQPSPVVGQATATFIIITWTKPVQPNGKILLFEVYRRTNRRIQKRSLSEPVVIHRVTDTEADTYSYNDTTVQSYTEYQYSISTTNSRGSTQGPWQSTFTDQAPPSGVQPPSVQYVSDQVDALYITWTAPDRSNGILQSYQIQRNSSVPLSFSINDRKEFTDTGLDAYTVYSYAVTVCSGGGCTTSQPTVIRTKETAPLSVSPPTLFAVNSTALRITWQQPQIATGEIIAYQLHMEGVVVYEGLLSLYTVINLIPFTDYTFKLTACTNGGCTDSGEVTGRPEDDKPENMLPPILKVMSSRSIEVSWNEPEYPNGVITSYDVRRNGRLIYTESISVTGSLRTTYTDYNLDPGTEYAYAVTARNRKGSVESPPSMARTFASSPSGLHPPSLSPISSTSIQVTWDHPASPNGVIKNYTLFQDSSMVYSGGPTQLSYIVPGLQFWTEYAFRVQACTERGCELSASSTARTLAARPEEIAPPTLLALANQDGAHAGVLVEWEAPLKPNGVIQSYKVYRRQLMQEISGTSYGETSIVYTGPELRYTDRDSKLRPYTDYQYAVSAVNSVGDVSSLWEVIRTKEAPPESVRAPTILGTTASTITVSITPPTIPNGIVRYYSVLVNETVGSSSIDLQQTVGQTMPLLPFRYYSLTVQACTAGGCTTSPPNIARTGTSKPSGQDPLSILDVNDTAVKLTWSHPSNPNGVITKFTLYQRTTCPPTSQPFLQSCTVGDPASVYEGLYIEVNIGNLSAYTAYQFQIQSENDAGPIDFPVWVRVETTSAAPVYVQFPRLLKNDSQAIVDWSSSFMLNSRLKEYLVMSEGSVLFRGVASRHEMERPSKDANIVFKVTAITETGQVESPVIVFDPNAVDFIGTTTVAPGPPTSQSGEKPFYQEIWFIVLMVLLGVLLLLLILGFCVRRAHGRHPYVRERMPLKSRQKKQEPFTFCVDANDGSVFAMNGLHPDQENPRFYPGSPGNGVVNPAFTTGHLRKKLARLDKESSDLFFDDDDGIDEDDDFPWERNQDSGLVSTYDDDTDSVSAPSYSITKEQTVFTDTHL